MLSRRLISRISYKSNFFRKCITITGGITLSSYLLHKQIQSNNISLQMITESEILKQFRKTYPQGRKKHLFRVDLADLSFILPSSVHCIEVKHPHSQDMIQILLVRNADNQLSAFRANCPYEPEKTLENARVFGNKLVCPHHGCEFHTQTGFVDKFPASYNLVKIDLININKVSNMNKNEIRVLSENKQKEILIHAEDKLKLITHAIKNKFRNLFGMKSSEIQFNRNKVATPSKSNIINEDIIKGKRYCSFNFINISKMINYKFI